MLSGVLQSDRAVGVNIAIMRAFVRMREALARHDELAQKIDALERRFDEHDAQLSEVFRAIRELMTPPDPPTRRIGFEGKSKPASPRSKRSK